MGAGRVAATAARAVFTGDVNWIGFTTIFSITMLVAPYGAQLAHRLHKRRWS